MQLDHSVEKLFWIPKSIINIANDGFETCPSLRYVIKPTEEKGFVHPDIIEFKE